MVILEDNCLAGRKLKTVGLLLASCWQEGYFHNYATRYWQRQRQVRENVVAGVLYKTTPPGDIILDLSDALS